MTANDSKFYLSHFKELVARYNNSGKPINAAYSDLIEKFETNLKAPKFKANGRVRITKYKNIFIKVTLKIGQEKYLLSILCWKIILGLIKSKF